ncbi:MAG: DNA-3-methyladenine glycosylase I, partial [Verrucomicrobiota bacterium]
LWNYMGGTPLQNSFKTLADVPAATPLSTQISKDLKKEGFKFCGPTIVYAFMQAVGMVNDHLLDCPSREHCARLALRQ